MEKNRKFNVYSIREIQLNLDFISLRGNDGKMERWKDGTSTSSVTIIPIYNHN
jgi:hypothetical protein